MKLSLSSVDIQKIISMAVCVTPYGITALNRKCHFDDISALASRQIVCHFDNLWCSQWGEFQRNDIYDFDAYLRSSPCTIIAQAIVTTMGAAQIDFI